MRKNKMVICEQIVKGKCNGDNCIHATEHGKNEYDIEPCTKYDNCPDLGIRVRCIYVKEK
jgi:hypothetical protein